MRQTRPVKPAAVAIDRARRGDNYSRASTSLSRGARPGGIPGEYLWRASAAPGKYSPINTKPRDAHEGQTRREMSPRGDRSRCTFSVLPGFVPC